MQKSKIKTQNEKDKFKKDFVKRLIKFSIRIICFYEKTEKEKQISWSILNQLVRSSTSIGANVVEAKASSSRKDYRRFFEIALKSANETKYWLILIKESYPQPAKQAQVLLEEVDEISKILGASILTLRGRRK